jgi:raffinose/stachyose/melibiose transport system permease protein
MASIYKFQRSPANIVAVFIVIIGALIILLPLLNIFILSISNQRDYNENPLSFIKAPQFANYIEAWNRARILQYGLNTLVVAGVAVLGILLFSSMCGYGISRFSQYKEISVLYYVILLGLFIPVQAIILPLFRQLKSFGLLNRFVGLSIIYMGITMPLSMMLFCGFFRSIPKELDDAAAIDGCTLFGTFFKIILPLSGTIIATVTILTGLTIWRDFFIPLVVITEPGRKTLGVGLLAFVDEYSLDWTKMCAAMVLQTLPIVALFLMLQRFFISGAVSGAVKG